MALRRMELSTTLESNFLTLYTDFLEVEKTFVTEAQTVNFENLEFKKSSYVNKIFCQKVAAVLILQSWFKMIMIRKSYEYFRSLSDTRKKEKPAESSLCLDATPLEFRQQESLMCKWKNERMSDETYPEFCSTKIQSVFRMFQARKRYKGRNVLL